MLEARTVLRGLVAEATPGPWTTSGGNVEVRAGEQTILTPAPWEQMPDRTEVANAMLIEYLHGATPILLWILHCGIEYANNGDTAATSPYVAQAGDLARAILGTTPAAQLELRARIMERQTNGATPE